MQPVPITQDVSNQLRGAVLAVFSSWGSERAKD